MRTSGDVQESPGQNRLAWDFTRKTSERLKRQVFDILHYIFECDSSYENRRRHLLGLREVYDFCTDENIEDIEQLELLQIQKIIALESGQLQPEIRTGILTYCRKALFMQADEINWKAHVWFLDRFHIQPERLDAAITYNIFRKKKKGENIDKSLYFW